MFEEKDQQALQQHLNKTSGDAYINTLKAQRNNALDDIANMASQLAVIQDRFKDAQEKVAQYAAENEKLSKEINALREKSAKKAKEK